MGDGQFVLGIDLGGTKMAVATAGADGTILRAERLPTEASLGATQAVERAFAAGARLVEETAGATGQGLGGVGVATMGLTREDSVLMAPNVPGWERLAIPRLVREAFPGIPYGIENDVKAAAHAELRWGVLRGCQTALYLNLGTGIAASLIVNGAVVEGANGAAGEIAYNPRTLHEEEGVAAGCAPLEEYVGGRAIGERASRRFGHPLTARDVFARAPHDVEARAFIEETLEEIQFHLTILAIALDPELIAIGGGLTGAHELIVPRLQAHLHRFAPFQPTVVAASVAHDTGLMGALAAALEARSHQSDANE